MQSRSNREIIAYLGENGIECAGVIPFRECKIINDHLLQQNNTAYHSVVLFLMPYYSGDDARRNISLYAVPEDYHLFAKALLSPFAPHGFSDHSPIDEVNAAAKAGLGIIGDNGLLINEKYGSFVFIGEVFSTEESENSAHEIRCCSHCGKCKQACPSENACLSAITQKKGRLTPEEERLIRENRSVWGCDICQKVCPYQQNICHTELDYFKNNKLYHLSSQLISEMDDPVFSRRAYSWRKRDTVMRNAGLCESCMESKGESKQ